MRRASRMNKIPPYLFLELDKLIARQREMGRDVISLGIGDPDQPTASVAVEALKRAVDNPETHRYPNYLGSLDFRTSMAQWYHNRFGVELDPRSEVLGLIGSKEGIAHLIWAMAEPGDIVLVPDPAYPVYYTQTILAGAEPYALPLTAERQFLPDLSAIPENVWARAKMLWLNYPNNPTGAIATRDFYEEAVQLCLKHDVLLCSDGAYLDIGFDGYQAPSILEIPGAKNIAIEFYSLSKPFNMTGWRIAAAVGNPEAIDALGTLKSNLDSGPFTAIQDAAIATLDSNPIPFIQSMNALYQERRDLAVKALNNMGIPITPPRSTFYLWFPAPFGMSSQEATNYFVQYADVVLTPGEAYGDHGRGWMRISLTIDTARLQEGLDRMARALRDHPPV
ncbi:LL-diaminopimelate aminotransferase apoenzyme [Sulfobacillus thermosulfidooxidans DSM 9293]|uniref:Aminotransferase n=1 Tax=Sulfobacillus thermosulfidooxidans (strain DSM 9293 / VKM B-1269 / AT-1) TaxID=929705 RepID=A0A1W1W824_SULTA|nr:LL-diaminopimelate aminotransferase [Sulfobacillus thermosulfidooxidans]SMC02279.1 LL-diaminopimelate aminotransferase apoenzyme [Sulfobacillus thermosulfidooxidans DSM 9293]